jgi:hypothetical protein
MSVYFKHDARRFKVSLCLIGLLLAATFALAQTKTPRVYLKDPSVLICVSNGREGGASCRPAGEVMALLLRDGRDDCP